MYSRYSYFRHLAILEPDGGISQYGIQTRTLSYHTDIATNIYYYIPLQYLILYRN